MNLLHNFHLYFSYNTKDRILYEYGNPILWSDNRQILGEEIQAFFNDSTMDSVRVINQALMVERMDSTYYNQVAGTEMRVYFAGKDISECKVINNVLVVYFPLDNDSIMTGMNYSETSLLRLMMENRKMKKNYSMYGILSRNLKQPYNADLLCLKLKEWKIWMLKTQVMYIYQLI